MVTKTACKVYCCLGRVSDLISGAQLDDDDDDDTPPGEPGHMKVHAITRWNARPAVFPDKRFSLPVLTPPHPPLTLWAEAPLTSAS